MNKRTMAGKVLGVNGKCWKIWPYVYCRDCPLEGECRNESGSLGAVQVARKYASRPKYSPSAVTNIVGAH